MAYVFLGMSQHSPAILGGESCYSGSFHPVPKKTAEFMLSAVQELPEVGGQGEGKVVGGVVERRRPRRYETQKHTAVCGQPPTVLADPPQQAANPS